MHFRKLKQKGLVLNMSHSVSGDPEMSNKITDIVVAARQLFSMQKCVTTKETT